MSKQTVFVTGASGFIGTRIVRSLLTRNYNVRAGVHNLSKVKAIQNNPDFEVVEIDICNKNSLKHVFDGVDFLYHFAASVNSKLPAEKLYHVNVEGTRNTWEAASQAGVKKTLYCSSTAVYGLLSKKEKMITEDVPARAVEPYGNSKLEGEKIVNKIRKAKGLNSIIIRPTAVFGPGERSTFGKLLKGAAYSKLLLSGGFQNKKFSYVHVQDVAEAAIHLMENEGNSEHIFNIAVDQSITYEEAFRSYLQALDKTGLEYIKVRLLGKLSYIVEHIPGITRWLSSNKDSRFAFGIWKPGFDLTFSSQRLLSTSYRFRWNNFEDVIASCIDVSRSIPN
ncbi:MAG: NAD-dependent epimerase/dehydratase family protein [Bacteroidetes bacterium]|nr:NAD-dependent epimerase/dehydratase family protein [Bacteroidota bacterium]